MRQLIDKESLIEAFENLDWYHINNGKLVHGATSKDGLYKQDDVYRTIDERPLIHPDASQCWGCNCPKVFGWISCDDFLPNEDEEVLTVSDDDEYLVNRIIDDVDGKWLYNGAIAWAPITKFKR